MTELPEVRRALAQLSIRPLPDADAAWRRIQANLTAPRRRPVRWWLVAAAAAAAVVVGTTAGLWWRYRAPSSWTVVRLAGAPALDGVPLGGTGVLETGSWLETDATSRAHVAVGRIGSAILAPGSRVRLERDGSTAHRLRLDRGAIEAVITAPPRLFFVETPSALATDLGCAYTLSVDNTGASRLHVTAGWVELAEAGGVSIVPAGMIAVVEGGRIPGTPYAEDLGADAIEALARLDEGVGSDGDLALVLSAVAAPADHLTLRRRGGVTLWHLLPRVDEARRRLIADRLAQLSPPPDRVTMEGIGRLDRRMLDAWRRDLSPMWSEAAAPWPTRLARRLWTAVVR